MLLTTKFGTYLLGKVGEKGLEALVGKGFDILVNQLTKSEDIDARFLAVVKKASYRIEKKHPDVLGSGVNYFFSKSEVFDELFKLLFYDSNVTIEIIESNFDISTLPSGFIFEYINILKDELYKDKILSEILRNKEILILARGVYNNLDTLVENTDLIKEDISEIVSVLQTNLADNFNFNDFRDTYTQNALNNLSQVHFVGLGLDLSIKKSRKHLQDIFVKPYFSSNDDCFINKGDTDYGNNDEDDILDVDDEDVVSYGEILNAKRNLVILGDPGSGKSTLLKAIICTLLAGKYNEFGVFNSLPIRIELRKYMIFKKNNAGNIINYMTLLLDSEYNIPNLTSKNIEYIIKNKHAIFFFDGLDEIFNVNDKIIVKNDIENFYSIYKTKCIVTSRKIGYEEAKLDENFFSEIAILNFDEDQIAEYVNKWYEKEEKDVTIRYSEIEDFLKRKASLNRELITNPLLLSLIVILFRNNLKLPESKLEIYQSCTKTLVDKWDENKELKIEMEEFLLKKKETIFSDLAYWQYEQLSSSEDNTRITNEKAISTIAETIIKKIKVTDEWIEAKQLAESFMLYAQKRSLYFDNNFTHKTFLEYFTAYWIYSNCDKKQKSDKRNEIISKYIANPFWAIVLELLLNMIDNDQPDSEIIDEVYREQSDNDTRALPFLLNIAPTMKNISNIAVKNLFKKSVVICLTDGKIVKGYSIPLFYNVDASIHNQVFERINDLIYLADKYLSMFNNSYEAIRDEIDENSIYNYYIFYVEMMFKPKAPNHSIILPTFISSNEYFMNLIKYDPYVYALSNNVYAKILSNDNYLDIVVDYCDKFGVESCFIKYKSAFAPMSISGVFFAYINRQISKDITTIDENLDVLEIHGISRIFILKKMDELHFIIRLSPSVINGLLSVIDSISNPLTVSILMSIIICPNSISVRANDKIIMRANTRNYVGKYKILFQELSKHGIQYSVALGKILDYNKVALTV